MASETKPTTINKEAVRFILLTFLVIVLSKPSTGLQISKMIAAGVHVKPHIPKNSPILYLTGSLLTHFAKGNISGLLLVSN
ncbi:hypothetical protein KKG41_05360 [Patescibacteria group bacterium]|nr:hypothetical protein [Patescibacteria group bacterium]MBU1890148.1 hypothetical protein [Patescibacteria group bacterium]